MFGENDDKTKLIYEIMSKRNEMESYLKKLEKSIYDCETKYLEGSQFSGNVLKGWDHIFTAKAKIPVSNQLIVKKTKFSINERIFSQTSFHNSQLKEEGSSSNHNPATLRLGGHFHSNNINHGEGKEGFIVKKHKKKIYSSLSLKKKKALMNASSNRNASDN